MQKNAALVLGLGIFFGVGLASCATSESSRRVAGDNRQRLVRGSNDDVTDRECYTGEERDSSGQCVRVQHIERPARKGGR
jgi:hypothetical protein